jgi:hypothetical protein
MHLNERYFGTFVHFVAKMTHSTMHSLIDFMKFTYYCHVQNHLYLIMSLIAKNIFLVLETIATTHDKRKLKSQKKTRDLLKE